MVDREILKYCLKTLKDQVDHCDCSLSEAKKYELNLENGEMSLLRTTINHNFSVTVLKNNRKGTISINKTDQQSIDEAIKNVLEICDSSEPDDAFEIAPFQEAKVFTVGDEEPDLNKMFDLLTEYLNTIKSKYPTIKLMDTAIDFNINTRLFMNSNGVDFTETKGIYGFGSMFAAKEGEKMSSFNYGSFSLLNLENSLIEYATLKRVIEDTTGQLETDSIEGKFTGDVIVAPDCLGMFIHSYIGTYLTDGALISGTSLLKDKLEEEVASPILTIHSKPRSESFAGRYHVTGDGYESQDLTIIDKGVLKSFLLSSYGANKTKLQEAKHSGGCFVVEPGDVSLAEMIKSVSRGVLINRVSGGNPNNNGDLSVVLKNSYYIENGEIKYPISETSISTNLLEALKNVKEISKESINFGYSSFPYVKISNVLVSGK